MREREVNAKYQQIVSACSKNDEWDEASEHQLFAGTVHACTVTPFSLIEVFHTIVHCPQISGVSLPAYWLANFAYDVIAYAVPGALAVALIAAFDIREWIGADDLRVNATIGLFALYGFSVTASTYLLSWCFTSYSTASNVVLMLNLGSSFVGIVGKCCMHLLHTGERTQQQRDCCS